MKKLISIIILSSLLFISCSKDEDNSIKFVQVTVNNSNYNFNIPSLSTDYNITKTNLEEAFTSVLLEQNRNVIVIKASQPKGENNLFTSITATYHVRFEVYESSNLAFTYATNDIDAQSYIKIKNLIKEQSTPKLKE